MEEMDCTSQCCRMTERPPATALSGGKTSEDSFTTLMANLVVEYTVDFQLDLFSLPAPGSVVSWSKDIGSWCSLCPLSGTDRIWLESAWRSVLHRDAVR
jgi:hypothetical protein